MRNNSAGKIIAVGGFLLLMTGTAHSSAPPQTSATGVIEKASPPMPDRASALLAEIQREAALLWQQADKLESAARNRQLGWQTHAVYLDEVKDHINAVGKYTAELQAMQDDVSPWQQQAIREVTSHAVVVADNTEAAIRHLQEDRNRLHATEYRKYLTTIADHSENMKQTVDKFLDYGKTQQKLQQLEGELEQTG